MADGVRRLIVVSKLVILVKLIFKKARLAFVRFMNNAAINIRIVEPCITRRYRNLKYNSGFDKITNDSMFKKNLRRVDIVSIKDLNREIYK